MSNVVYAHEYAFNPHTIFIPRIEFSESIASGSIGLE